MTILINTSKFKFFDASTNTRILGHPETIDNKKDIDLLVQKIQKMNLVEKLIQKREDSAWKFYEFNYVRFDVYEIDSPTRAGIQLPEYLLKGSNQKYLRGVFLFSPTLNLTGIFN